MKKLLALILSVILILSVMPVAFAADKTVAEAYLEELSRLISYIDNVYEPSNFFNSLSHLKDDFYPIYEYLNSGIYITEDEIAKNEAYIAIVADDMAEINAKIENEIVQKEVVVVIDTYAFYKAEFTYAYYEDRATPEMNSHIKSSNLYKEFVQVREYTNADRYNSQAEYDEATEPCVTFYKTVVNHILGNHDFIEYVSNNDATEEADGTKTATCEFCGATDTVVDEGSKLVKEPASFIEMLIALIKSFFEKILSIFG